MTLIVGFEDGDRCIVASDRIVLTGETMKGLTRKPKIFRHKDWILGIAGPAKASRDAQRWADFYLSADASTFTSEQMLDALSAGVAGSMLANAELVKKLDESANIHNCFHGVAARGKELFFFSESGVSREANAFVVAGQLELASGAAAVAGLLMKKREDALNMVMTTCGRLSSLVSPPYDWMATDGSSGQWA